MAVQHRAAGNAYGICDLMGADATLAMSPLGFPGLAVPAPDAESFDPDAFDVDAFDADAFAGLDA